MYIRVCKLVLAVSVDVHSTELNPLRIRKDFDKLMNEFEQTIMMRGLEIMKNNTPVKTGNLRDTTIVREKPNGGFSIFPTAYYASYVNEGTKSITPRRYVEASVEELKQNIRHIARNVFPKWERSWGGADVRGGVNPVFPGILGSSFNKDFE